MSENAKWRFRLRTLLLLFLPISIVLAIYSYLEHRRDSAVDALNRMSRLGIDAHFKKEGVEIEFKNGNVSDDDLIGFLPAWNGYAPRPVEEIVRLNLCGSPVSDGTITQFRDAVPTCEVVR